ncbi:MAG TPA: VanZ family protein [Pyrinomonadaceae bacterium]|nr:VanZ family protein [Pyrinomonadaceae bacterium]
MRGEKLETRQQRPAWLRIRRYGPLFVWMAFIFFASTGEFSAANTSRIIGPLLRWLFPGISDENLAFAHFLTRKAAHFTEYAVLAWLAARAFATSSGQTLHRRWFLISLALVVLYALSDEYHQSFVASRTASIYDSLIDMSGGLTALLLYALRRRRIETRRRRDAGTR